MKIQTSNRRRGFALLLVLILIGISLLILSSAMQRTQSVSIVNQRNNEYAVCCSAAEAAVEKAYAQMVFWFQSYNVAGVTSHLSNMKSGVPGVNEDAYWSNFIFTDPSTSANGTCIYQVGTYGGPLPSAYVGLYCTTSSPVYRIISNAKLTNSATGIVGTSQEDVLLALVPLNTWAIFYNGTLEFTGCATMTVNGRVHANGPVCVGTGASLTFNNGVSTTSTLTSPGEGAIWGPYTTANWNTTFNATPQYTTNVASVTVSLAMTNSHFLIDIPPSGEDPLSTTGQQRLYNQAQMILIVTNDVGTNANLTAILTLQNTVNGNVPGSDSAKVVKIYTNLSSASLATNLPFLALTNTAYDQREYKTNLFTQIDVGSLSTWITQSNSPVQGKMSSASGQYPTIMYVADRRNYNSRQLPSVRLVNGSQLPANGNIGFSVATQNPLYVWGNYNTQIAGYGTNSSAGTTNTTYTVPAALMSDSITVLSSAWTDSQSFNTFSTSDTTMDAADDTINAAIITGAVPTTTNSVTGFSGGVHNLTRLLEDWSSSSANSSVAANLWLNTSILRLWDSQMATNQYRIPPNSSPPAVNPYYRPPTRKFSFDPNYLNPAKVPPGIPLALVPIRFDWGVPPPGVTNYTVPHN
jgi:hypothetical protein